LGSWQHKQSEALKSYADMPAQPAFDRGQYTFTNHCAACHTIGRGDQIGPDLLGVTATRDRGWLARFIVAPDRMNAAGDPIAVALRAKYQQARMPNLSLAKEDVAVVIDYLERQGRAMRSGSGASPATAPQAGINLMPMVEAYVRIQQALSLDTIAGIKTDADRIAAASAKLDSRGESIRSAAIALARASNLTESRTAFAKVGDAIMRLAKESGASLGAAVKVAYCPMARKYWLQKGDHIQNPFYGKSMSDCGRINPGLPVLAQ
jgi:mono/diheme cytochrome c family protein